MNDRIILLNDIGFEWNANNDCGVMYQRLGAYKTKCKNARVPFEYKADPQLGYWVHTQRFSCKEKDLIDLLNDIRFEWQIEDRKDWKVVYYRILMYKKKHGTKRVPRSYKAGPKLGHWVHTQRSRCEEKDRMDLLNNIGFEWQIVKRTDWEVMCQRLLMCKNKYGTTRVPKITKQTPNSEYGYTTIVKLAKRKIKFIF